MSQSELIDIENAILAVKNNSEYKRLAITHRNIKDDQRFKAHTLQLQTLEIKRVKLLKGTIAKYTPNGRIIKSTQKPQPLNNGVVTILTQSPTRSSNGRIIKSVIKPPGAAPLKTETVVKTLLNTNSATAKGRLLLRTNPEPEPVKMLISTANRTIVRAPEEDDEPEELMIKPTRTSIKVEKIPVKELVDYKTNKRAEIAKKIAEDAKPVVVKPVTKARTVKGRSAPVKRTTKLATPEPTPIVAPVNRSTIAATNVAHKEVDLKKDNIEQDLAEIDEMLNFTEDIE